MSRVRRKEVLKTHSQIPRKQTRRAVEQVSSTRAEQFLKPRHMLAFKLVVEL